MFYDLEVPDFGAAPIVMNDLLLTAASAIRTPTPISILKVGTLLPAPTTTVREFAATDMLTVAAGVCDNAPEQVRAVDLRATVRSEAGAEVFQREEHKDAAALSSTVGGFNWVIAVPLTGLAPGRYVLTVEAHPASGDVVRKATEFRVK